NAIAQCGFDTHGLWAASAVEVLGPDEDAVGIQLDQAGSVGGVDDVDPRRAIPGHVVGGAEPAVILGGLGGGGGGGGGGDGKSQGIGQLRHAFAWFDLRGGNGVAAFGESDAGEGGRAGRHRRGPKRRGALPEGDGGAVDARDGERERGVLREIVVVRPGGV